MSSPRSRLPHWLAVLLVWGLLWAPLWGHWHSISHGAPQRLLALAGPHEAQAPDVAGNVAGNVEGNAAKSDHAGHAAGSELCQVLDHLAHADRLGASSAPWSAPRVPAQAPVFGVSYSPERDRWSPAQARAPPALI